MPTPGKPTAEAPLHSLKAHVLAFVTAYNFAKQSEGPEMANALSGYSGEAGRKFPQSSKSIRTTSFRDHTPSIYLHLLAAICAY